MTGSRTRITVYVPTRERPPLLRQALSCLRSQTLARDRFRVIVADNASADETGSVVAEFSDLDVIHLRRERNIGLVANWCGAAAHLDTEFFHFLSDDDLLAPFHLELALARMDAEPGLGAFATGVLYGSGLWERDASRGDLRLGDAWLDPQDGICRWTTERWLAAHSIYSAVCINACLVRSDILHGIEPLFDDSLRPIMDRWLMAQIGARAICATSPWPTCFLRVHGGNAIHGGGLEDIEDVARASAARVLGLARELGIDLVEFWRVFFATQATERPDLVTLIERCYPPDLANRATDGRRGPGRRLDALPLPSALRRRLRDARARWRRSRRRRG